MIFSKLWKKRKPAHDLSGVKLSCNKDLVAQAVQDLCVSVGWAKRDLVLITRSLQNSVAVVGAWHNGNLIGFARATGDGVFNATIWDVVVHPDHQGIGVGQLIMRGLLKELDNAKILLITLLAEPGQERFYKKFGFITDAANLRGMVRERH
jgi:GNAT superfamily N-acetyltransferase